MNGQNLQLMEELYKDAKMGMQATKIVLDKTSNTSLKKQLTTQYGSYAKKAQQAESYLINSRKIPKDSGLLAKAALWGSIQFNALIDSDVSHIAEMVINGSTMGIVGMTKKLNELKGAEPRVRSLAKEFIHDEEHHIAEMRSFLA